MGVLKGLKLLGKVCPSLNIVIGTVEKKIQHLITKFPNAKGYSPEGNEMKKIFADVQQKRPTLEEHLKKEVENMRRQKRPKPISGTPSTTTTPPPLLGGGINKTTLWNK